MALQSPGVEVTVIDESFYTPAEPGTTPLIVVATGQDKTNAAGTGVASATTKANAGKAFKVTSQRDLVDIFGVPFFEKTASSSPVHGSERNEYGLLAAYSLLGVSNAAFIVRADVDLTQLEGQATAPGANPADGTWWVDTSTTAWGILEWNGAGKDTTGGQKFAAKIPTVLSDADVDKINESTGGPIDSVGVDGEYAVVLLSNGDATVWFKRPTTLGGGWVLVGSEDWAASWPTVTGSRIADTSPLGNGDTFVINGATVSGTGATLDARLASLVDNINANSQLQASGVSAKLVNRRLYLYTAGSNDGDSSLTDAIYLAKGTGSWASLGVTTSNDVATYYGPRLQQSPHTSVPRFKLTDPAPRPTGSVWLKTTVPNQGADWQIKRWNAGTESWVTSDVYLYSSTHAANYFLDRSGGGAKLDQNVLFVQTNSNEYSGDNEDAGSATFKIWRRAVKGATVATSGVLTSVAPTTGVKTFTILESQVGSLTLNSVTITTAAFTSDVNNNLDKLAKAINDAAYSDLTETGLKFVVASYTDNNTFTLTHTAGGEIRIVDTSSVFGTVFAGAANVYEAPAGSAGDYDYLVSNWKPLAATGFIAAADTPSNEPVDGQLWYNPTFAEVDIMVHNGNTWVGYMNEFGSSDPNGPQVTASMPTTQSDGTALVDGDLWISTADLENYPTIYRFDTNAGASVNERWVLVDKTDQVSEDGILFADARYGKSGATGNTEALISELLESNYLDFDAPDPALYPRGMLLWNTRRSGGNVKRYVNSYIDVTERNARYDSTNSPLGNAFVLGEPQSNYASADGKQVDRWVTASPNQEDGSGTFGRKAQRSVVVAAMKSVIDTSEEIRDEERRNFNLIAAPGYPELLSNLVNLNIDRGVTAFVVGDTPLRLKSDATTLTNWGTNANLVLDNGDNGIVTYDEYCAVFYPNGFTTDLGGTNAVVPASHMMLRTIALSDNASYPWFAPAGTRRGGITNATAVGYIDSLTGEFQSVSLNEGQRDTLYDLKVNPITFFNGIGLVNYGQKTRARNASALDRINVARLVVYLRSQLNKLARPYIFEPNDKITRDEVKQACESLLLELVGLRALYDFAVVCDESNNTPARIDRNELWVDIAIEPVKAVEFIYIPLRVKNTGEI